MNVNIKFSEVSRNIYFCYLKEMKNCLNLNILTLNNESHNVSSLEFPRSKGPKLAEELCL